MAGKQHRHDVSDSAWEKIRPYIIDERGTREELLTILGNLSTVYSGFCVPERLARTVWTLEECTPPVLSLA